MGELDIYHDEVTELPKDRAFRITLENPYASLAEQAADPTAGRKSILYFQHTLHLDGPDGEMTGLAEDQPEPIRLPFDLRAQIKLISFTDPVTQQALTVSLAGVATAINIDYVERRRAQLEVVSYAKQLAAETITLEQFENIQAVADQYAFGEIDWTTYETNRDAILAG